MGHISRLPNAMFCLPFGDFHNNVGWLKFERLMFLLLPTRGIFSLCRLELLNWEFGGSFPRFQEGKKILFNLCLGFAFTFLHSFEGKNEKKRIDPV